MKHTCTVMAAAGLLLVGVSASAQSLADVARQEQERRKTIATPARVYTDADVDKNAPLTTAAARPQAEPAAGAQTGDGKAADAAADKGKDQGPPKDEAGWRSRVDQAREDSGTEPASAHRHGAAARLARHSVVERGAGRTEGAGSITSE